MTGEKKPLRLMSDTVVDGCGETRDGGYFLHEATQTIDRFRALCSEFDPETLRAEHGPTIFTDEGGMHGVGRRPN
jgi:hypothetical protein